MSNSSVLIDILFTNPYPVMLLFALILAVSLWLLISRRNKLPAPARGVLVLLVVLALLYFAVVVWLVIGFGSNAHPPIPNG